jgi:class 3 adenylate cyclase
VVTVLFTDVSGFTSMSEKLDPEEVTNIVNQFFDVLTKPIYKYGGVVDKYIGDAIMALFGAPVAHEDYPFRAVSAAWEMQLAAKSFADKLLARTGIQLRIRVGLNTGLVIAGAVGGSQKQDYTVMGDTVNLAQRMEANASLGGILVTQETYAQTCQAFEYQKREPLKVKGKQELVQAYDLLGPKSSVKSTQQVSRFVGRETELNLLKLCLEGVKRGNPQIISISGDAGIGKTRLFEEFSQSLPSGWTRMWGRCPSWAQETSYAAIANLLSHWLDLPHQPSSDVIIRCLKETCALLFPSEEARAVSLLGYLLAVDIPHPEVSNLSPQQKRSAAFWLLNDLVFELSHRSPLMICLENLHWIDEASFEWLRR